MGNIIKIFGQINSLLLDLDSDTNIYRIQFSKMNIVTFLFHVLEEFMKIVQVYAVSWECSSGVSFVYGAKAGPTHNTQCPFQIRHPLTVSGPRHVAGFSPAPP